jgi:hypothetical protein
LYPEVETYVVMDEHDEPITPPKLVDESLSYGMWTMHFDGARSKSTTGARVVLTSPSSNLFPFSFHLEFDCTNNMVEFEALLLCLEQGRKIGIKLIKVKGDSKLVVNQIRNLCDAKNPHLKRYWDKIECFKVFDITIVPRTLNHFAYSMASFVLCFQPCAVIAQTRYLVEVIFRPRLQSVGAKQEKEQEQSVGSAISQKTRERSIPRALYMCVCVE